METGDSTIVSSQRSPPFGKITTTQPFPVHLPMIMDQTSMLYFTNIYTVGTPGKPFSPTVDSTNHQLLLTNFFSSSYDETDASDVMVLPYARVVFKGITRTKTDAEDTWGMLPPPSPYSLSMESHYGLEPTPGAPMWNNWDTATMLFSKRGGMIWPGVFYRHAFEHIDDLPGDRESESWSVRCVPVKNACFCLTKDIIVNGEKGVDVCIVPELAYIGLPHAYKFSSSIEFSSEPSRWVVAFEPDQLPSIAQKGFTYVTIGLSPIKAAAYYDAAHGSMYISTAYSQVESWAWLFSLTYYISVVMAMYWYTCKYGSALRTDRTQEKPHPRSMLEATLMSIPILGLMGSCISYLLMSHSIRRLSEYTISETWEASLYLNLFLYGFLAVFFVGWNEIYLLRRDEIHSFRMVRCSVETIIHSAVLFGATYLPDEGSYRIISAFSSCTFLLGRIVDVVHLVLELCESSKIYTWQVLYDSLCMLVALAYVSLHWHVSFLLMIRRKYALFMESESSYLGMLFITCSILSYAIHKILSAHLVEFASKFKRVPKYGKHTPIKLS